MMKKRLKIKKDDTVKVMAGKDKGKEGKVIQVFPEIAKVVVDKVNIMKKHIKPQQKGQQGQVIEFSGPLHVSNVMIVDPENGKASRVGFKKSDDGKKIRISKKSGANL